MASPHDNTAVEPSSLSRRSLVAGSAWAIPTVLVVGAAPASAASPVQVTVTRFPTATTSSEWTNPTDAYTDNSAYATTTPSSGTDDLILSNFGFAIPSGATINAVTAQAQYRSSLTTGILTLRSRYNGAARGGVNTITPVSTTDQIVTQAATGFTVAELNSTLTQVMVTADKTGGSPQFFLDYVSLTVQYTV